MLRRKPNKSYKRKIEFKTTNLVVIAVEGQKTEPRYFRMLQEEFGSRIKLEIVLDDEHKSSPQYVLERLLQFKAKQDLQDDDVCWMVIDVDGNAHKLPQIIKNAKSNGCKVALSNPCFEIWLSLHRGDIKITDDFVIFYKGRQEIVKIGRDKLTARAIREADILNKINHGVPNATLYKSLYFDHIEGAIKKSKKLIESDKADNFLCEKEHKGKTRVGELLEEIIKKLSQNTNS
jgi:hypothetical protein